LEGVLYVVIGLVLGFLVEKERKRHRDLLRVESLAAIGKAVSEIAHDMKTPLVAIGGFASQISRKLHNDDPNRRKMDVIVQEASRLESMVKEMLDFGSPLELQLSKVNLNELIKESLQVAQPIARKAGVELKADLGPSLPLVLADIPKVKQVLLNLVVNAIQASPAGEHLLVKTRVAKDKVVIEVIDCGCGIEEDARESIFHPFFSTKKGGTGLGLAIVRKIVEAHGGGVSFDPNTEKGVTFSVRLPIFAHTSK
jgi:signal transduction histidine kinase